MKLFHIRKYAHVQYTVDFREWLERRVPAHLVLVFGIAYAAAETL
jgi:hypothetical protein